MADSFEGGLEQYTLLLEEETRLKAELKEIQEELARVSNFLLTEMAERGFGSVKHSGRTFFPVRSLYVSAMAEKGGGKALAAAFQDIGMPEMVSIGVNQQKLNSWAKEFAAEHELAGPEEVQSALPPRIQEIVRVSEVFRLGTRKS